MTSSLLLALIKGSGPLIFIQSDKTMNKTNMKTLLILSIAACVATVVGAVEVRDALDQLPAELREEANKLKPIFAEIDGQLELSNLSDSGALMDLIAMFGRKEVKMFDGLTSDPRKNALRRKAYKLFLALAKVSKQCDFKSYKVLAMNHIALDADMDDHQRKAVKLFKFYTKQHAMYCRPTYRFKFQTRRDDEAEYAELESAEWVEEFFGDFEPGEHILDPTGRSSKMPADFLAKLSDRVLLTMSHPELGFRLSTILESNLVEPCAIYYHFFRGIFAPAIYDSQLEDKHQAELLDSGRGDFGVGLQHFRACGYIVRNRKELLDQMAKEIKARSTGAGIYMRSK